MHDEQRTALSSSREAHLAFDPEAALILDQEIIAQIKRRQRTMVRLPRLGGLPPVRERRAYVVKSSQKAKPACDITIESIQGSVFEDKPVWVIRFKLGNHTDEDRYLAARPGGHEGDYTSVPARKLTGTGAEVSAEEQNHYAEEAHESHRNGSQSRREHWLKVLTDQRRQMASEGLESPRALKLLKAVQQELGRRM